MSQRAPRVGDLRLDDAREQHAVRRRRATAPARRRARGRRGPRALCSARAARTKSRGRRAGARRRSRRRSRPPSRRTRARARAGAHARAPHEKHARRREVRRERRELRAGVHARPTRSRSGDAPTSLTAPRASSSGTPNFASSCPVVMWACVASVPIDAPGSRAARHARPRARRAARAWTRAISSMLSIWIAPMPRGPHAMARSSSSSRLATPL